MTNIFIETITHTDSSKRDRSFESLSSSLSVNELEQQLHELDEFRSKTKNLYEGVRANLFLYQAYRFVLQASPEIPSTGKIPFKPKVVET